MNFISAELALRYILQHTAGAPRHAINAAADFVQAELNKAKPDDNSDLVAELRNQIVDLQKQIVILSATKTVTQYVGTPTSDQVELPKKRGPVPKLKTEGE